MFLPPLFTNLTCDVPCLPPCLANLAKRSATREIGRSRAGMEAEWPGVGGARNAESDKAARTGALDAECARVLASVAVDHRKVVVYYSSYCHGSTMALIAMALLTMALPSVAPLAVAPPTITQLTIVRSSSRPAARSSQRCSTPTCLRR